MAEAESDAVEALFHQAADLPPAEQQAFLDAACRNNPDLRAEVEKLLADDARLRADEDRTDFLHSPLVRARTPPATLPTLAELEAPRPQFARYRILRVLGEGGMGTVYEAEQDDPQRTVALKVMRPGHDSTDLRKRFSQEARILGRLHHPGIAQVYDAGVTEDGR